MFRWMMALLQVGISQGREFPFGKASLDTLLRWSGRRRIEGTEAKARAQELP